MEINFKSKINKIALFVLIFFVFTNCGNDSDDVTNTTDYTYYYPTTEATITAKQIGDGTGTLDPKGITIANDKLYVCNGNQLDVFNAKTLAFEKTIQNYIKDQTTIALTKLSSVCVDGGRIYLGSVDSRIFVLDEKTNNGISTIGNGQWWNTFVHVFGLAVKDGLLIVKEKEKSIKVFETSQITETSDWNLKPIAKLNTLNGYDEIYSMDIYGGNLVVAGQNAKGFLYYKIADIKANATASLTTPLLPTTTVLEDNKPISVNFSTDWAITSENIGSTIFLRMYAKDEFINNTYKPVLNSSDVMGQNPFGNIVSIAQLDDRIFLSDNTNQKITVIKLKKATISEQ